MSQKPEMRAPVDTSSNVTNCSNCHSPMPSELRFCRNCGFRLGEGVAEYTPTVRFGNDQTLAARPGMAPVRRKIKRRMSGMTWIFIGLLGFFICAAAFTAIVTPLRHTASIQFTTPVSKSYVGVDGFETTEGGVTFGHVDAPDGPADKAGLVGGDVITSFDGQAITNEDQMSDLLASTPIGKTVDVVYVRDGETKTTKLTTIAKEEFDRLNRAFEKRPEGKGQFGYNDRDSERVPIPGTKIFGVKLNSILQSRPADLAGIKEGDIVTEFDGIPIRTPEELLSRIKRALPYSTVKVVVMRDGQKMEIPVKMGKQ